MRKPKKTLCLMMVFVLIFAFNASFVAETGGRALSDSVVIYGLETAFDSETLSDHVQYYPDWYDELSIELQAEQELVREYHFDWCDEMLAVLAEQELVREYHFDWCDEMLAVLAEQELVREYHFDWCDEMLAVLAEQDLVREYHFDWCDEMLAVLAEQQLVREYHFDWCDEMLAVLAEQELVREYHFDWCDKMLAVLAEQELVREYHFDWCDEMLAVLAEQQLVREYHFDWCHEMLAVLAEQELVREYHFDWCDEVLAVLAEQELVREYHFDWCDEVLAEMQAEQDLITEYYSGRDATIASDSNHEYYHPRNYGDDSITPTNVATLTVSPTTMNFTSVASNGNVNVSSNRTWTISSNVTWITFSNITPTNRTGNGSFRINATANTGTAQRVGTVTITAPGATTRTVTVTQAAAPATLTVSPTTMNFTSVASNGNVNVSSNRTWTISSNVTWITFSNITPTNRTGNGSFRINATANTGTAQRVGTVTITAPGATTRTVTVTQAAAPATLTVSPTTMNFTSVASNGNVNVSSNRTWTISSNVTWITFSNITPTNRTGNGSFRINATANTGTAQRVGTVTITAPGATTRTVTVTQAAAPATLTVSPTTMNFTSVASNGNVNVSSNRTWTISSNVTWITFSNITPTNRTGNGSFRINATANTGTAQRVGTVTITAPGATTRTVTVTQAAGTTTLTISPATNWTNIPSEGGTMHQRNVTVTTSATSFTVSAPSWLNIVNLTGSTREFRLVPTHNTTTSPRTGTVTVTAGNQTRSFSVAQLAGPRSLRNGTGTFYMQAQGRNLFLQGSNVRTRNLPSQQWQISFQTSISANRYYRISQGNLILAVTAENIHGHTVAMATPGSLSHANRGLWRFEQVGDYHYRIVSRWTSENGWGAALTSATTNGGAVTLQTRGGANQLWYIRNRANFTHDLPGWHYPSRIDNRTTTMYLCRTTVQGSGWEQAIRDGILAWNVSSGNRNAGVSISLRTTGAQTPHRFEVRTRNASSPNAFGAISVAQWGAGNIIEHSISRIYAARINDYVRDTSMSALNVARSVTAHEVGHMLGLNDDPPQFTSSIMHGRRTRHTVISHSAFDARNVRIMYGAQ